MEYKIINLEYLHEVADGDNEFVMELIKAFLLLGPEEIDELRRAYAAENWPLVAQLTHKLKSASESLGVKAMSENAATVEAAIRDTNFLSDGGKGYLIETIAESFVLAREEFQMELRRLESEQA